MTASTSKLAHHPLPADDPTRRKPDIALAQRVLGWTPRVALDDGLTGATACFRGAIGGAAQRDFRQNERRYSVILR